MALTHHGMTSEKFDPHRKIDEQKRLSRRGFLVGVAAFGAASLVGIPSAESAPNSNVPTVDEIANVIKQAGAKDDVLKGLFGGDPEIDVEAMHSGIEDIMKTRPGAKKLSPDERVEILTKADRLEAAGRRARADVLLCADRAQASSMLKPEADFRKDVEEKVRPAVLEVVRVRDELRGMRDDLDRRFPQ